MLVNSGQICCEVLCDLVQVGEYFLEVLFHQCEKSYELDIAEAAADVVSNRVVLVADQHRKLDVQFLEQGVGTAFRGRLGLQLDCPMAKHTLQQEVEADEEVDCSRLRLDRPTLCVHSECDLIHLEDLRR